MKIETRSTALTTKDRTKVGGYAAVFNSPTDIGGMWVETIEAGAFSDTLTRGDDVLALYSHELERLLGRKSSGTLRLAEDDHGLSVEIDLPDTSDGRDVATLIERGDLKGMSFGFIVTKETWDDTQTPPVRTIHAVDLREVTITADPAYTDTEIGLRSLSAMKDSKVRSANFNAAARRIQRKMELDLRTRRSA